jgi:YVTN family beta-propeller protein
MDFFKKYLLYETNRKEEYIDYGEIVSIINDRLVNVNVGGARDSSGSLIILEAVAIEGGYIPKIGDWVGIEWRNGQPIALGSNINGLRSINDNVKVVSSTDITSNVINSDHIKANIIEARHIKAGTIQAEHISANSIKAEHISANSIQSQHIGVGTIDATHVKADAINGTHIQGQTITGTHISGGTVSADHLTVSSRQMGLLGQYFSGNNFDRYMGDRVDSSIDLSWGVGSPSIVGTSDNFSIRWQGQLFSPEDGTYTFYVTADSGAKLWVDNKLIVDAWSGSENIEKSGQVALTANSWNTIRLDFYESTGDAGITLKWTTPTINKSFIPSKYFSVGQTIIDGKQILTGTITANEIKVGSITAESGILADASITTAHIVNGSIVSAHIGNAEIKTAHIATGNITNALIQDASIEHGKIKTLDAGKIVVGFLSGDRIDANTITGTHISGSTITATHIKADAIDSSHIKAGSITATEIAGKAVQAEHLQAGAITGDSIRAGTITSDHISTIGLDAQSMTIYNSTTGETLIGGGYLRVDGLDVGVVRSDNLVANGLFLTASSSYGFKQDNPSVEILLGSKTKPQGGHQLWKIDLTSGSIVSSVDIAGKKPYDIAVDISGNFGYVTVQGDNSLVEIDLVNSVETGKVLKAGINSPARTKFVGHSHELNDKKHLFILNTDSHDHHIPDSLVIVDTPSDTSNNKLYVHHTIPLGNNPYDFTIDDKHMTYITMGKQGDIVSVKTSMHGTSKNMGSGDWWIEGRIPISAYGTDNYHGGLPGAYGLKEVTGGDSAFQYMSSEDGHNDSSHSHGGYGSSDSNLKQYEPRGIAQSADADTLYVCDYANNEIVVVDKYGNAPYNGLTGRNSSSEYPDVSREQGEVEGGGPTTRYVRYRIPIGDSPDFIEVVSGKLFITLEGSGEIAIIDEQAIIDEINADREFYKNWTVFDPMRALPTFTTRKIHVGSKPSHIKYNSANGYLYTTLNGQNQIVGIDVSTETVEQRINVGTNPIGLDISPDGAYMYVINHGGAGELSFVYPSGSYIGDPYLGLEGGVEYQGAEHWTPSRSSWVYDTSGNVKSMSTIEFRVNEPFLNEGGYSKFSLLGKDRQHTQVEQDIYNVTNFSNGNNKISVIAEKLKSTDNTIWYPKNEWLQDPAPSNINIAEYDASGNIVRSLADSTKYSTYYGANSRLEFSGNTIVPSGGWVEADYTARNNIYFKPHNGSLLVAVENGSSTNFKVQFEIDEFVPKFITVDNQQTNSFTPTENGINETYTGLYYSTITNRSLTASLISGSASPVSGNYGMVNDDILSTGNYVTLPSGNQYIEIDLGKKYMIGKVVPIHKYDADRVYQETKTQVSEDGINWVTVYDSAISGTYNEKSFHEEHGHYHYGKAIVFDAMPVRYIRDYTNGWVSGDGLSSGSENDWSEVQVHGDWELEEGYSWVEGSEKAGQQIATNGKGFVSTNISKAFIAMDIQIEYTSWWYMTYITGPQFGTISVEMPTLMNSSHFLFQESPYVNKIAHRHIMSFPPSSNIKANSHKGIKAGKHRVILRQESGRVTIDRLRFEDFQYYSKSSLLIPSRSSTATFTRYKLVTEQSKWYEGVGIQSTYGPYDEPRRNPDTGLEDKSVPIKYRLRFKTELNPDGTVEERGTAYMTSCIMETGKLHTHWRRSEASDSFPASRLEAWNGRQPHKTGIQSHHIANGAIRGNKILIGAIMDHHISNYARIQEHKLDLRHPTHRHGYINDSGNFVSNKEVIDSVTGWYGLSGNYGTSNKLARGDHFHSELHTHSNKNALDVILGFSGSGVSDYMARADHSHGDLADSAHTHSNKDVLDGIIGVSGTTYDLEKLSHSNRNVIDLFSVDANNKLLWSGNTIEGGGGGSLSGGSVKTEHIVLADGTVSTDTGSGIIAGHIRDGAVTDVKISSGIDGAKLSTSSVLNVSKITATGTNHMLGGSLTVSGNGLIYAGATNGGGSVYVRTSGANTIHLDGTGTTKASGVKAYINKDGNAIFDGTMTANKIQVTDQGLVTNLNANFINGVQENNLAKNLSILELGGYGVQIGLNIRAQDVPNMTVLVEAGTVYTNSGMRVVIASTSVSIATSSSTYDRKDIVYIQGSSGGANEGNIAVATGTASSTPAEPSIPNDAVKLAVIYVKTSVGSITDGTSGTFDAITDARKWKPFKHDGDNAIFISTLKADLISSSYNTVSIDKPIKSTGWAISFTIPAGSTSYTWTHNLNLSSYVVTWSTDSPNRHIYWSNKQANSVVFNLDDTTDVAVSIDAVITSL